TILDIQRVTGVREIVIDAAGPAAAAVPIEDLQRFLLATRSGPMPALSGAAPRAYATGAMAAIDRNDTGHYATSSLTPAHHRPPTPQPPPVRPAPPQAWIPAPRPHLSGPMQQVDPGYRRCTHPILPALR